MQPAEQPLEPPLAPPARRRRLPRGVPRRDPGHLSSADRSWLRMDRPESQMIITSVLRTGAPLSTEQVQALLAERLLAHPRFRAPPFRPRRGQAWPRFELGRHVHRVGPEAPGDEPALQAWIAERMRRPLPLWQPLWEVHVIERFGPGSALVFRLHHALADGASLMGVLLGMADRPPASGVTLPMHRLGRPGLRLALASAATLARLALRPRERPSPLKRPLQGHKRVAWSPPLPLDRLKAAAHREGATLNDLLVAALSQALGDWLARAQPGRAPRNVRAIVPFDLRAGDGAGLGNRFGLLFLSLPVGPQPPRARLAEVRRRTRRLKRSPEGWVTFELLRIIGWLGPGLSAAAIRLFGAKASLVLTNVVGPEERLHLAGAPLDDLLFWVPQAGGIGLGVSIISYAGSVRVGIASDVGSPLRPEELVQSLLSALAALGA